MMRETFEQFMARALHDPVRGYYARQIIGVGRRGDFTTAPMLSDAPARAIATWMIRALKETGCRHVIEIGPGEGTLAAAVWAHLPRLLRWQCRLHLVETSAPLADQQRTLLGRRPTWHNDMVAALRACHGQAVIFSNELVDAFPVRRFERTPVGWQEIGVEFENSKFMGESLLPLAPLPCSSGFSEDHPIGQRIEVHESYQRHLASWLPDWRRGRMLTIDYGGPAETLYHRRQRGTVRGYLFHQRLEGLEIYANPGRQDLTADVNFRDLVAWSEPWLETRSLQTLGEFLGDDGGALADPHGAGGAFQVLDQAPREHMQNGREPVRSTAVP